MAVFGDEFACLRETDNAVAVLLRHGGPRPVSIGDDQISVRRNRARGRAKKRIAARPGNACLAQGLQHLSVLIELEHLISAASSARNVGEGTAIARPEIAVAVLAKSVGLHEHAVTEGLQN